MEDSMPGISAVIDVKRGIGRFDAAFRLVLPTLLHDERYTTRDLVKNDLCRLTWTAYQGYPLSGLCVGDASIYLEGYVYGTRPDVLRRQLTDLAPRMPQPAFEAELARWLTEVDGDFVLLIFDHATGDLVVANDVLGRLPVYYHQSDGLLIVSRELRYVAGLLAPVQFDRMAIAQHLLMGYPLGDRTLLAGVRRLAPATCIRATRRTSAVGVAVLHQFNLDCKTTPARSVEESAGALVKRFSEACEARVSPDAPTVVSLSGGFDSRAIAACLHRSGISFRAFTFLDHAGNAEADVPIAKRLADLFDSRWDLVRLGAPTARDVLKLLRLKTGMNPLGMSFLLPFLDRIKSACGSEARLFTGEFGTLTLPDLRPHSRLSSVNDLAHLLINVYHKFPLDVVAWLTGVAEGEIIRGLECLLSAYPEERLEQKFAHFVFAERAIKWGAEGEDRNRCYVWSTTPFSGLRFFRYAMGCPDEQKRYFDLYREFFVRLSPAAAAVAHAGIGASLVSDRFRVDLKVLEILGGRPELRLRLIGRNPREKRYAPDAAVIEYIRRQVARCDRMSEILSLPSLHAVLEQCASRSVEQMDLLFTITSVVEDITTGSSVLETR
jgi:asparagine synthase (glutamine-hydrolysing)